MSEDRIEITVSDEMIKHLVFNKRLYFFRRDRIVLPDSLSSVISFLDLPCGKAVIKDENGYNKVQVLLVEVDKVKVRELKGYWVKHSGFSSKEEWINVIKDKENFEEQEDFEGYIYRAVPLITFQD